MLNNSDIIRVGLPPPQYKAFLCRAIKIKGVKDKNRVCIYCKMRPIEYLLPPPLLCDVNTLENYFL